MTISTASLLSFSLSFLLLSHFSLAEFGYGIEQGRSSSRPRFTSRNECRIETLNAQEPTRRVESEAGRTEFFDENNEQFECAGVVAIRRFIQPRGLLLPLFYNAPAMVYFIQGKGIYGEVVPGCPESFQSFQQRQPRTQGSQGESSANIDDQHQRVDQFREGDAIAVPAGVTHWIYNNGDKPIIYFMVFDKRSSANQLGNNLREFLLAGNKRRPSSDEPPHKEDSDQNILAALETKAFAEAAGISVELAEKIKGRKDNRGEIVKAEGEFHIVRPSTMEEREESKHEGEREGSRPAINGLDQAFCSMKIKYNIDDQDRADIYNPNAGRTTTLNSQKLPILRYLQLNAVRGVLRRNAFVAPHWNINAHSVMYVTRGSARVQIVSDHGNTVFNDDLRQGQVIVVPQNFALLIQARSERFEWVAIKTNDNAMVSPIVGKTSVLKGLPEEVLRNAYRLSKEEARKLKYNRGEEMVVFEPSFSSKSTGVDA